MEQVGRMSIGEFAAAAGLSAKALRLYDDMGLLRPAEVDASSGYRRYRPDQLGRAQLVARLRLAGLPLARIRVVVDARPRAAAAELTSYWRQVEADTATARDVVSAVITGLVTEHDQEERMTTSTALTNPRAAARAGVGGRTTQEDAVHVGEGFYAVADGVGDASPGLSAAVVARVAEVDRVGDRVAALDAAVGAAAALVDERYGGAEGGPQGERGAACTLTALTVRDDQVVLAHVGDSRAHLVRGGRLERLTRDHTVVQTLVDEGRLTQEEARADDRRVVLNRAIAPGRPSSPDLALHAVRPGDRLVLTTDGVHGCLDPATLTDLLVAAASPDEVAAHVEDAVLAAGAEDNYAVVVIDL